MSSQEIQHSSPHFSKPTGDRLFFDEDESEDEHRLPSATQVKQEKADPDWCATSDGGGSDDSEIEILSPPINSKQRGRAHGGGGSSKGRGSQGHQSTAQTSIGNGIGVG